MPKASGRRFRERHSRIKTGRGKGGHLAAMFHSASGRETCLCGTKGALVLHAELVDGCVCLAVCPEERIRPKLQSPAALGPLPERQGAKTPRTNPKKDSGMTQKVQKKNRNRRKRARHVTTGRSQTRPSTRALLKSASAHGTLQIRSFLCLFHSSSRSGSRKSCA